MRADGSLRGNCREGGIFNVTIKEWPSLLRNCEALACFGGMGGKNGGDATLLVLGVCWGWDPG
jgi:hypothetical protein